MSDILFVDIPTYSVSLDREYTNLLNRRLKLQKLIMGDRLQSDLHRGQVNYSRGLLSIATCVFRKGIKTKYLIYSDPDDRACLEDSIVEAKFLAISALTPTIDLVIRILRRAKKINPQIITIVGGPHTQHCAEDIIQDSAVDIVSVGDGLESIPLIAQGYSLGQIPNLLYKAKGALVLNTMRDDKKLSKLLTDTFVEYSLLSKNPAFYSHNLRTQNGCPFRCSFCYENTSLSHTDYLNISIGTVIEEIRFLNQRLAPGTLVHFSDPVFTLDKKRTVELCKKIAELEPRIYFSIDTRLDCVDKEIITALTGANILIYRFGVEDSNQKVLNQADKGIGVNSIFEISKMIRDLVPQAVIMAYWITGLPGTTLHTIKENAIFIKRLVTERIVDIIGNKILVPYPGTNYAERPEKYGMHIKTKDWQLYDRLSKPVYDLDTMSSEMIYNAFIYLEEELVTAYEEVLSNHCHKIVQVESKGLDYVFLSYIGDSTQIKE